MNKNLADWIEIGISVRNNTLRRTYVTLFEIDKLIFFHYRYVIIVIISIIILIIVLLSFNPTVFDRVFVVQCGELAIFNIF